jgi:hypothetical protein
MKYKQKKPNSKKNLTILEAFKIGLENNKFLKLFKSKVDPILFGENSYFIRYYYMDEDVFINEYFIQVDETCIFEHYITFSRDGYEFPYLELLKAKLGRV